MSSRKIQSPGVEINEIDRSQYGKVDYSLPNAPTVLMAGVATKGEDYALKWINSKSILDQTYGMPTTEFERYFYNSMQEVLNRGGTCIAAKLPYSNFAKDKFNYVDFYADFIDTYELGNQMEVSGFATLQQFHDALTSTVNFLSTEHSYQPPTAEFTKVSDMAKVLSDIVNTYDDNVLDNMTTIREMFYALSAFIDKWKNYTNMYTLAATDSSITSYIDIYAKPSYAENVQLSDGTFSTISSYGNVGTIEELDDLLTGHKKIARNTFRIYDMTRSQYGKFDDNRSSYVSFESTDPSLSSLNDIHENDFLGIVPIVVTPANALFFQELLDFTYVDSNPKSFSQASHFTSIYRNLDVKSNFNNYGLSALSKDLVLPIASVKDDNWISDTTPARQAWASQESLSKAASDTFPFIRYDSNGHFNQDDLKKVGIAVFKAFKDTSNNGKVNFMLLESFIGSFDQNARDLITNADMFIDNVVNSSSQFIRLFSNIDRTWFQNASTLAMSQQPAVSLGFYKFDCQKLVSYTDTITKPLTRILDVAQNPSTLPLDIVVDAGMSNIAQIAYSCAERDMSRSDYGKINTDEKPNVADYSGFVLDAANHDTLAWRAVLKKFDDFAKYTRKDCMFIADGLRTFCLDGNAKIVRSTKPQNNVTQTILPKLKWMSSPIDSSYSAGYCNWYYQKDASSGRYLWVPPSIKTMGVCIYCDTYFQPWSAPAGLVRGVLNDVVDVAFVPNEDEAGKLYNAQWNYAMSYPLDGIVIEGHKTFQTQRTALDRINVRRLMLYLEKRVVRIARRFVYEGNTPYRRQLFVDTIRPIFEDAVKRDGVVEYAIKCDDELNTTQVIENNEMRCKIAVKPVKCVDFIVVDFIASRQSASVTEEVLR